MSVSLFGIRHHGPGSARSLLQALQTLQPDCVLVEGPPDALLLYQTDQPPHAAFYPFAVFSPEWQALRYGLANQLPTRFMDLPQAHPLARAFHLANPTSQIQSDPIGTLAHAAGYPDGERCWEHLIEHRRDGADLFAAIAEAMSTLRNEAGRELALAEAQDIPPGKEAEFADAPVNVAAHAPVR